MSVAVWIVIVLALFGANLPFLNQRLFAVIPLRNAGSKKSFWLRLLELLVCYFLLGGLAYLFEVSIGNVFPQGWEFFAISACLFIVFAFPGFVYQYLRRQ
ncbi:DUF2818 family protein [Solimicrobium silvestre]|uniref:DUF2818 family protein n=1 Tax=Solimicrobium silvestre TaxID=2099400 RepID=UPI000CFCA566|nr:DUF2818 family protein [Solimicrobium silvestre]